MDLKLGMGPHSQIWRLKGNIPAAEKEPYGVFILQPRLNIQYHTKCIAINTAAMSAAYYLVQP